MWLSSCLLHWNYVKAVEILHISVCFHNPQSRSAGWHLPRSLRLYIFTDLSLPYVPLVIGQITEVRRYSVAATGHCAGGSGRCGKEESGESDSLPARYWSNTGPSATSSSTSPIGCQRLWVWQEGAPTVQSLWTGSTCGTPSGELGCLQHEWYQLLSFDSLPSLCASLRSFPLVLSLQLPLPVSLTQRLFSCRSPCSFNKPFVTVAMGAQREGNSISHSHTNV